MKAKKEIEEFIRLNPETRDDQFVVREFSGIVEWICEHGVGHPITGGVHGCCGCCSKHHLINQ